MKSRHLAAMTIAVIVSACGNSYSPSYIGFSGAPEGTPCNAALQLEGCLQLPTGFQVMVCEEAGAWAVKAQCASDQYCAETNAGDRRALEVDRVVQGATWLERNGDQRRDDGNGRWQQRRRKGGPRLPRRHR